MSCIEVMGGSVVIMNSVFTFLQDTLAMAHQLLATAQSRRRRASAFSSESWRLAASSACTWPSSIRRSVSPEGGRVVELGIQIAMDFGTSSSSSDAFPVSFLYLGLWLTCFAQPRARKFFQLIFRCHDFIRIVPATQQQMLNSHA